MISLPPPAAWERDLDSWRAMRDRFFRTSPETPLRPEDRSTFDGLEYWDADPRYYFVGPIRFYPEPERMTIVTTAGKIRPCEKVGWIEFDIAGQAMALQVYRLLDSPEQTGPSAFFLPFMDGTTGDETYPAGRYLDLAGAPGGPYILDFNRAYNPSCAYGAPERFACPRTPEQNRLAVRIEAGERGYVEAGRED